MIVRMSNACTSIIGQEPFLLVIWAKFRSGIVDFIQFKYRPGAHQIVHLFFYKKNQICFFLKTEEIPGFLRPLVITTVKSGTEQPTSAGRHTVTELNNPPPPR